MKIGATMTSNGSLDWASTTFPVDPLSDDACFNEDDFDFDDEEIDDNFEDDDDDEDDDF